MLATKFLSTCWRSEGCLRGNSAFEGTKDILSFHKFYMFFARLYVHFFI